MYSFSFFWPFWASLYASMDFLPYACQNNWWNVICLLNENFLLLWREFCFNVQMSSFVLFDCFKLILIWNKHLSSPSTPGLESFGWLTLTSWLVYYKSMCTDLCLLHQTECNRRPFQLCQVSDCIELVCRVSYVCMFNPRESSVKVFYSSLWMSFSVVAWSEYSASGIICMHLLWGIKCLKVKIEGC